MTDDRNKATQDPLDETVAAALDTPESSEGDELARLRRERDELQDRLLRTAAEFDNYRKRTERERAAVTENISAGVLEEFLPLVDDLERALRAEAGDEGAEAYRQGVELILKGILDLLGRRGVKPIDAVGTQFDPNLHQAVSYEPAEGYRDGEVVEEFRRGYTIGDRLLRPSMVKVAKG
ncbi:MAG TPA: nucleotide exchange factor GrpE [Vicinamibacterales bacterium]